MNRIWQWLTIVSVILSLSCVVLLVLNRQERAVYIDTYKVYSGFSMTKRLQKQLEEIQRAQVQKLDSLRLEIDMAVANVSQQKDVSAEIRKAIEFKRQEYMMRQQQTERERASLADKYDSQIWAQLNQYISDYGKEKKLRFIFGANGSGSLMYGDAQEDISDELVNYVNSRHQDL